MGQSRLRVYLRVYPGLFHPYLDPERAEVVKQTGMVHEDITGHKEILPLDPTPRTVPFVAYKETSFRSVLYLTPFSLLRVSRTDGGGALFPTTTWYGVSGTPPRGRCAFFVLSNTLWLPDYSLEPPPPLSVLYVMTGRCTLNVGRNEQLVNFEMSSRKVGKYTV